MRSIINLNNINRSLSSLGRSVQGAIKRTENISENVKKRNLEKKEFISVSKEFFAKRRDLQRRREKEELLEASSIVGILKSSGRSIRKKTKGFLGRILEFIGKLILGWAILNLPKIIKISQDVIKRMQKYFAVLTKFVSLKFLPYELPCNITSSFLPFVKIRNRIPNKEPTIKLA